MGPTPTPTRTLGMRLSCNFVNVYTIVYHVQYMYTCIRGANPQRTFSRGKARASDKSPRTSRRAKRAARAAAGTAVARQQPREDPRAEVGEKVRVAVGVRVGAVEFKLISTCAR